MPKEKEGKAERVKMAKAKTERASRVRTSGAKDPGMQLKVKHIPWKIMGRLIKKDHSGGKKMEYGNSTLQYNLEDRQKPCHLQPRTTHGASQRVKEDPSAASHPHRLRRHCHRESED